MQGRNKELLTKIILQPCCKVIFSLLMVRELAKKINPDGLGIVTSVLCAVHCAVLPLFFTTLPVFGFEVLQNKTFEFSMIGIAGLIGVYALQHGYKRHHHKKLPLAVFLTGLSFLILKEVFVSVELLLLIPAAGLIIGAHFLNFRFCRQANHCHATDCNHEHLLG